MINELQIAIMRLVCAWVKKNREPISQQYIVDAIQKTGIPEPTIRASVRILVRKGFIRKAIMIERRNEANYVLIRTI